MTGSPPGTAHRPTQPAYLPGHRMDALAMSIAVSSPASTFLRVASHATSARAGRKRGADHSSTPRSDQALHALTAPEILAQSTYSEAAVVLLVAGGGVPCWLDG